MQSPYVWYSKSLTDDSPDVVHNTLALGTLEDINRIKDKLGVKKMQEIFLQSPMKVYRPATLNFTTKFILQLSQSIDETRYLKTTPRYPR